MDDILIYSAGATPAAGFARETLLERGIPVTDSPGQEVTHLLMDVPSFAPNGELRGGGKIEALLAELSKDITICGGNLDHPAFAGYHTIDLLKDPLYLAENAYITAECALDVALPRLTCLVRGCPVLILGWGRIGKCLAQILKDMGAEVIVAARRGSDRAILAALGFRAADISELPEVLPHSRLIFNTVPELVVPPELSSLCSPRCVKIDLASRPGIAGPGVLTARGLPGLHRPESSGRLIAKTLLRLIHEEDTL